MGELGNKRNRASNREVSLATGDKGSVDTRANHLPGVFESEPCVGGLPDLGKGKFIEDSRPDTGLRGGKGLVAFHRAVFKALDKVKITH